MSWLDLVRLIKTQLIHIVPYIMKVKNKCLGDVTQINTDFLPRNIDLLTHGSPCQAFSVEGKKTGGDEGSGTTSSLMWETVRIIKELTFTEISMSNTFKYSAKLRLEDNRNRDNCRTHNL